MSQNKGITLIALVVTIIILLILASVSIIFLIGPDGIVEKARNSKVAGRYGTIMDQIYVRDTEIEVSSVIGKHDYSDRETFINKLIEEDLITNEDTYDDKDFSTISLGIKKDGTYMYTIDVPEGYLSFAKNMTLIIETTKANEEVEIPINKIAGLTINWDVEKNPDNFVSPDLNMRNFPTYTYATINTYEVQIKGQAQPNTIFGDENYFGYENKNIVGLKDWGENGFSSFKGFGRFLKGNLPPASSNSFTNVIDFSGTFFYCTYLSGSIPVGLFNSCSNVTTFENTFVGCSGLTGNIPVGLFNNCSKVITFGGIFSGCSGLSEIPVGLFDNNPNVINFDYTFSGCSNLTAIPFELFDNCTSVTSFYHTFANCINVIGNPPNILDRTGLETEGCFRNCTKLSGYASMPNAWK